MSNQASLVVLIGQDRIEVEPNPDGDYRLDFTDLDRFNSFCASLGIDHPSITESSEYCFTSQENSSNIYGKITI